jgi:hypothetical protein
MVSSSVLHRDRDPRKRYLIYTTPTKIRALAPGYIGYSGITSLYLRFFYLKVRFLGGELWWYLAQGSLSEEPKLTNIPGANCIHAAYARTTEHHLPFQSASAEEEIG